MSLPVQGIVAALEGMKIRRDRGLLFQEMTVPKLVLLGKKDPVLEYDSLRDQLAKLGSEINHFSGGHMSYIENKEELTYEIMHFIEK